MSRPRGNSAPVSHRRRSFLTAVGRTGQAVAAAYVLRSGARIFAPSDALAAQAQGPLVQPSVIRSKDGVLSASLTAAPGRLQLGDYAIPGFLYNGSYMPPL